MLGNANRGIIDLLFEACRRVPPTARDIPPAIVYYGARWYQFYTQLGENRDCPTLEPSIRKCKWFQIMMKCKGTMDAWSTTYSELVTIFNLMVRATQASSLFLPHRFGCSLRSHPDISFQPTFTRQYSVWQFLKSCRSNVFTVYANVKRVKAHILTSRYRTTQGGIKARPCSRGTAFPSQSSPYQASLPQAKPAQSLGQRSNDVHATLGTSRQQRA